VAAHVHEAARAHVDFFKIIFGRATSGFGGVSFDRFNQPVMEMQRAFELTLPKDQSDVARKRILRPAVRCNGYRATKLVTTMPTSTVYAIPTIVAAMTILSIFASLTGEGHPAYGRAP
jgi:hypothetical protein